MCGLNVYWTSLKRPWYAIKMLKWYHLYFYLVLPTYFLHNMLCARRLKPTEIKKENDSWGVCYHKFSLKAGLQTSHGQRRCFYWSKVMMSINFLLRQGHYKITFNQKDDRTTKTPLCPHDEYKRTFTRLFFVFIFFI